MLGDVIVGIDATPVRTAEDLFGFLDNKKVGDRVAVEVVRGGGRLKLDVTLGERKVGQGAE